MASQDDARETKDASDKALQNCNTSQESINLPGAVVRKAPKLVKVQIQGKQETGVSSRDLVPKRG